MKLAAIITEAYDLFAPYTIGKTLALCKACCITDAEEKALVDTPLREVSRDLLQGSYYESARNYSDQELWEMKHFLPRVLELVTKFEFPCHCTEITFTRLDLNQPEKWKPAELELLYNFSAAYFDKCLGSYPLPAGDSLSDILVMFGIAHFALEGLLEKWSSANTPASLMHLKDFMLHEASYSKDGSFKLTNPFSTSQVDAVFAAWLQNAQVKQALSTQLENRILNPQGLDEATLGEVSWAYDTLQAV